jgi:hypothetical protein
MAGMISRKFPVGVTRPRVTPLRPPRCGSRLQPAPEFCARTTLKVPGSGRPDPNPQRKFGGEEASSNSPRGVEDFTLHRPTKEGTYFSVHPFLSRHRHFCSALRLFLRTKWKCLKGISGGIRQYALPESILPVVSLTMTRPEVRRLEGGGLRVPGPYRFLLRI